jgi:ABC-type branched-subunit amino acid transport system ATPase component
VSSHVLQVESVSRSFGGLRALDQISLSVPSGAVSAVIGPNGAGKSTLFNIIAGSLRADAGSIRLLDRDITRMAAHRIAHLGVARTFQTTRLFARMSVVENVMVGAHVRTRTGFGASLLGLPWTRREEAQTVRAARAILAELGLGGHEEDIAGTLSFGQQRLLELARALASRPRILLLDEPAAGLNTAETERLGALIRRFQAQDITVILVEHDMSLVMDVSDSVVVLAAGRKLAEGPPRAVQVDPAVIEAYLGPRDQGDSRAQD